jgi:uncharacterized protein with GYD domain
MGTYIALSRLTDEGREKLGEGKGIDYMTRITQAIEAEGGTLEHAWTVMGPYDFVSVVTYPDNEVAFRAIRNICGMDVLAVETYPAVEAADFLAG